MKPRDQRQSSDWRMMKAHGQIPELHQLARYRARKKGYRAFLLPAGHNQPLDGLWVLVDQRTAAVVFGTAVTVEEILDFLDHEPGSSAQVLN
jgi:hypothetical protein